MLQRRPGVEDGLATVAGIHHDTHSLDGQRSLRDGRCQHHLPLTGTARRNGAALLLHGKQTIKRTKMRLTK